MILTPVIFHWYTGRKILDNNGEDMKNQITQEKIRKVAEKIAREFDPEKIILFGSFVWGDPRFDSDVDLLVIKKTNDSRRESRNMRGSVFPSEFPLDIIVYDPDRLEKTLQTGDTFLRDILVHGKVLYERSNTSRI